VRPRACRFLRGPPSCGAKQTDATFVGHTCVLAPARNEPTLAARAELAECLSSCARRCAQLLLDGHSSLRELRRRGCSCNRRGGGFTGSPAAAAALSIRVGRGSLSPAAARARARSAARPAAAAAAGLRSLASYRFTVAASAACS